MPEADDTESTFVTEIISLTCQCVHLESLLYVCNSLEDQRALWDNRKQAQVHDHQTFFHPGRVKRKRLENLENTDAN